MKALFALAALVVLGLSGCGGKTEKAEAHEAILDDALRLFNDLAETLEGVKDEDSAAAAVKKVETITDRLDEMAWRMKSVGDPSEAEKDRLRKQYKPKMDKVTQRLQRAYAAVGERLGDHPELAESLQQLALSGQMLLLGVASPPKPFNPRKLVGYWEAAVGQGSTKIEVRVEFFKSRKLRLVTRAGGKDETLDGDYRVVGDRIEGDFFLTFRKIKVLTESELVLEDEKGERLAFRRKK
jgi:uncharacterized protein (TIGR03066 family)